METRNRTSNYSRDTATDSRLEEFFIEELKDVYNAEKQITKALPKMQEAANSPELRQAFEEHLDITETQISRLDEIFDKLGEESDSKKCEAMDGIIDEGEDIIKETEDGTATRDVGLIMAAQKVEHYEIATYGSLVQLANTLGFMDIAELLQTTLEEEKEADLKLSDIAMNNVNYQASEEHTAD